MSQSKALFPRCKAVRARWLGRALLFAALYFSGALLGNSLSLAGGNVTAIWPPAGVFLSALLLCPRREWSWLVGGLLVASLVFGTAIQGHSPLLALALFAGNLFQALLASAFIQRGGHRFRVARVRSIGRLIVAAAAASALNAVIGVAAVNAHSQVGDSTSKLLFWWLADVCGMIIVTPMICACVQRKHRSRPSQIAPHRWIEAAALAGALLFAVDFVFAEPPLLSPGGGVGLPFIVLPFLLWSAMRFGPRGAAVSAMFVVVSAAWFTSREHGSFDPSPRWGLVDPVMGVDLFSIVASLLSVLPAAIMAERRDAGEESRRLNASLEARVLARTKEAQERGEQFRFMADAVPDIVWTAKPGGELDYCNRRGLDYAQVTIAEMPQKWPGIVHPEDSDRFAENWTQMINTAQPLDIECRLRRASDETYRWHLGRAFPRRNGQGEIVQWVGAWTDIEDQKIFEQELQMANQRLEAAVEKRTRALSLLNEELEAEMEQRNRIAAALQESSATRQAILDSANASIIFTDAAGIIRAANATAGKWLGYTEAGLVGRLSAASLHDSAELAARATALSMELGRPLSVGFESLTARAETGAGDENEWTYIRSDGTRLSVSVSVTAVRNEAGNVTGFVFVAHDLTMRKLAEQAVRESEARFRGACEASLDGFFLFQSVRDSARESIVDFECVEVNRRGAEMLSATREAMIGRRMSELLPAHIASRRMEQYMGTVETSGSVEEEFQIVTGEEKLAWFQQQVVAVGDGIAITWRDVSDRKAREETQRRLVRILENTTDAVSISDVHGDLIYMNRAGRKLAGVPAGSSITGMKMLGFLPEWAAEIVRFEGIPVAMLEGAWQGETALLHSANREVPVSQLILSHRSENGRVEFLSSVMRDISERKEAEEEVRRSLLEKETLLKEIHHRVKNNLQIISSLLQLQASYLNDPASLALFAESQDRIRSMALIHEKLYQSASLAAVDFSEYLRSLVSMLFAAMSRGSIRSELQLAPVTLGLEFAIPLGLIANELVSNCLKHAFRDRPDGIVRLDLEKTGAKEFTLSVRDDGAGIPASVDPENTRSLGLRLVRILTAQIGGKLDIRNEGGAEFRISFETAAAA
jgi:PAS domain S-box-containing protein